MLCNSFVQWHAMNIIVWLVKSFCFDHKPIIACHCGFHLFTPGWSVLSTVTCYERLISEYTIRKKGVKNNNLPTWIWKYVFFKTRSLFSDFHSNVPMWKMVNSFCLQLPDESYRMFISQGPEVKCITKSIGLPVGNFNYYLVVCFHYKIINGPSCWTTKTH